MLRIVVIDSVLNEGHRAISGKLTVSERIHVFRGANSEIIIDDDICDNVGHGTSVVHALSRYIEYSELAELIIIKVFDDECDVDEDLLLFTLNLIDSTIPCDLINLSAGITTCSNFQSFNQVCESISSRGTCIVAAYSNDGAITYPAAFDCVIGVDTSLSCFTPNQYQYVKNSIINIRGMGYSQRLATRDDCFADQRGSSFIVPHVVGQIALGQISCEGSAHSILMSHADTIIPSPYTVSNNRPLEIHSAVILPVSKEINALIEHADYLPFKISQVADFRHRNFVGRKLGDFVYRNAPVDYDLANIKVCSIDSIDWGGSFDTVIVGHCNMTAKAIKRQNIKQEIIDLCSIYKKQMFVFDAIDCYYPDSFSGSIRIPHVGKNHVPVNRFGKLHCFGAPILGIVGTGSKQGKFTLQLNLRHKLKALGYNVANLGTEPSSELFGFEGSYPIGMNSTVQLSGIDAIQYIDEIIAHMDKKNPDIVIVGSQSQSIPRGFESTGYIPVAQHEFILGTRADAYILCVNYNDDISYVARNISYLTSIYDAKVIAIVASPLIFNNEGGYITNLNRIARQEEMNEYLYEIRNHFEIKAFSLTDNDVYEQLIVEIQSFFS